MSEYEITLTLDTPPGCSPHTLYHHFRAADTAAALAEINTRLKQHGMYVIDDRIYYDDRFHHAYRVYLGVRRLTPALATGREALA